VQCASFFDKAPELVQLRFFEVQIDHQVAGDSFRMLRSLVQPSGYSVLVHLLDPPCGSNPAALGQTGNDIIECLLAGLHIEQRSASPFRESPVTHFALQKLGLLLAVAAGTDDLVIWPYVAMIGAVSIGAEVHAGINSFLAAHCEPPLLALGSQS